ncbi:PREDICTED: arginine kinase-like [Dufourea novaeangliae]|uniref:arginine kinase n=1 Tax=Dufourea novaeangliae TaxID=178035 RepID=A0A154NYD3_DUFNO|nr:PREDICTED: arginine kinase-like [Dufourea novaeangliae]KZC04591.1 Arginine kinase [Dufourea novaeangliae]
MCDKRLCACAKKQKASVVPVFMTEDDEKVKALENAYTEYEKIDSASLLKKHLSRAIFDKLKIRATNNGSTLMDVIQSGLKNPDSHVGLYAADQQSYDIFAELFDPVIEEYHGNFTPQDVHPELDWGSSEELGDLDPDGKYVISTRIRCARSIDGYTLNPTMTMNDYQELENKVQMALKSLEGELKGTFYTLMAMDKETQQQLIDDHFLFKEGDRFLEAANSNRFWPSGRGIFFNDAKTFLVWCNEEDHLRLISMEKGGNLSSVHARLVKAVTEVGQKLKFSRHRRLGYLTFCPTNLGTTIRASVHAKLPKLSADYPRFEEIASMYNLQIRGTEGEHTESKGGVYDISNKRRLGLTEREVVLEMRNGVLELIKQEKQLEEREA